MEEVDNIILLTLRQLGTEIPDDVTSLKTITTEIFVEGCARCINVINNNEEMPLKLPAGMSARFRVGTTLANAVKALGFGTDIGYNNFLYGNESDSRSLLMWLVERLPKESSKQGDEVLGPEALLQRAISSELSQRMRIPWVPAFCHSQGFAWTSNNNAFLMGTKHTNGFHAVRVDGGQAAGTSAEVKRYNEAVLPLITEQPALRRHVAASVLQRNQAAVAAEHEWEHEWATRGASSGLSKEEYLAKKRLKVRQNIKDKLKGAIIRSEADHKKDDDMLQFLDGFAADAMGKASMFRNKEKLQFAKEEQPDAPRPATEEELKQQRDAEIAGLEGELNQLNEELESLSNSIRKYASGIEQLLAQTDKIVKDNEEREEAYKVRKQVLDLLPNADENIAKLQAVVDNTAKKLMASAEKWEAKRVELIAEYRNLKIASQDKENESKKQLEKIKTLRAEMKVLAEGAKGKELLYKQLEGEYEALNKDILRSSYTRRILEIVKSIKRQQDEITKTLIDIRVLQKDINQLSDKLSRTFTVTDELIFADAKKDEAVRQAYKYLASMHENCDLLIKTVEDTGSIMREIRSLEEQIDTEQNKKMEANLARIQQDYQAIKQENDALLAQLKN